MEHHTIPSFLHPLRASVDSTIVDSDPLSHARGWAASSSGLRVLVGLGFAPEAAYYDDNPHLPVSWCRNHLALRLRCPPAVLDIEWKRLKIKISSVV